MIVLFDDERTFKTSVLNGDYILLKTSSEALTWLKSSSPTTVVDQLWFDHDLGLVNGVKETTIPFLRELEERHYQGTAPDIREVVVHTSNSVGGDQIEKSMRRYFPTHRVDAEKYLEALDTVR